MVKRTFATAAALSLWIPNLCMAGGKTLTVGDQAPALDVAHWLKGEAVDGFETGKIYVVEFWATWCAPCRASIPHVSELQTQFEDYDVTLIGISDEPLQTVVKFLTRTDVNGTLWNDKIGYTLAADPDGSTHGAYMRPAAQLAIPTAFVVGKDSRIEWIGGPMELDEVLGKVIRDAWDRAAFKEAFEKEVAPTREWLALLDDVDEAVERGDWDAAMAAATAIGEKFPEQDYVKTSLFRQMLKKCDDPARTFGYGRKVMQQNWDNAGVLNSLAWFTVDDRGVRFRDLDFAMEAGRRASELTDDESPAILDTVARVYYEKGDLSSAIKWQRKAVEHAGSSAMADELKATLIRYEKKAASRL